VVGTAVVDEDQLPVDRSVVGKQGIEVLKEAWQAAFFVEDGDDDGQRGTSLH